MQSGRWCPKCRLKTQNNLATIVQKLLNTEVIQNYRGFDWLKNDKTGRKQEIDIYVPSLKLAIEYHGQQHYMPVRFGGINKRLAEKNFWNIKALDRIKKRKIKKYKEDINYFIVFPYSYPCEEEFIKQILINSMSKEI